MGEDAIYTNQEGDHRPDEMVDATHTAREVVARGRIAGAAGLVAVGSD